MSHQIIDNMIAWKGEQPWHGLGVEVPAEATGVEMLQLAKLNWHVQRRMIAMRDAAGKDLLTVPLSGYRAIVRQDTDEVFQVATDRYHPIQNEEIVEFFREYCEAGHARMETVGGLNGGSKVWALAKLNGGTETAIDSKGEDQVKGYLLLATSHDGSLRTVGKATQVRVVCYNTLSAALGLTGGKLPRELEANEFRMKHSRKFSPAVKAEAQTVMGMAIQQIQAVNRVASELAKVKVDDKGRFEFITRLLGTSAMQDEPQAIAVKLSVESDDAFLKSLGIATTADELSRVGRSIYDSMLQSPGSQLQSAKGTAWGMVNGVTWYVDHERGRNQDNRLSGAWFGEGDRLKRDAVKVAVEMAGIGGSHE